MKKDIYSILAGDVPDDVAHWLVDFHMEFDDDVISPQQAAVMAFKQVVRNPIGLITHVRSGLTWHLGIRNGEIEIFEVEVKGRDRLPRNRP